jgi:hypothetical protein
MTRRARPEQPVFVLTLRAEEPATDVVHRLRRGLKFLWRACHLRAVDVREIPDRPESQRDDPHQCGSLTDDPRRP